MPEGYWKILELRFVAGMDWGCWNSRCLQLRNQLRRILALAMVLTLGLQAAGSVILNLDFVFGSVYMPFLVGNLHMVLDMGLVGLALSAFRGAPIARDTCPGTVQQRYT